MIGRQTNHSIFYHIVPFFHLQSIHSFDFFCTIFTIDTKNCEQVIIFSLKQNVFFQIIVTHLLYLSLNFSTSVPFFNLCTNSLPFFFSTLSKSTRIFALQFYYSLPFSEFSLIVSRSISSRFHSHGSNFAHKKISFYRFSWKSQSKEKNTHPTTM